MSNHYTNDIGSPALGLGFNGSAVTSTSIDNLMKQYLQQCLDYHEEQQRGIAGESHSTPQFVIAPEDSIPVREDLNEYKQVPIQISIPENLENTLPIDEKLTEKIEEHSSVVVPADILAKARAVALSFSSIEHPPQQLIAPTEFKQQRIRYAQHEQELFRKAWMKNLQYIAQRDEETLQRKQRQIESIKMHEKLLYEQEEAHRKERTIHIPKRHATTSSSRKRVLPDNGAALYISGIPTNTGEGELLLRTLFGSYGKIQKVHLYRHQSTGELKGDGLLVFQLGPTDSTDSLVHLVCAQMNGCELPCGSVLCVLPAESDYKKPKVSANHYGPGTENAGGEHDPAAMQHQNVNERTIVEETTEDLDDFFASLT